MTVKFLVQHAMNKNVLGFVNALEEELRKRTGLAIESKMRGSDPRIVNEADYEIGGDIHQSNHADMAQMHKEMAEKHRKMGGPFNLKAAQEHDSAAKAQEDAANHVYSYERSSGVHTSTHEPNLKAARAILDKAAAQSKAAFSASHLADAEEKD